LRAAAKRYAVLSAEKKRNARARTAVDVDAPAEKARGEEKSPRAGDDETPARKNRTGVARGAPEGIHCRAPVHPTTMCSASARSSASALSTSA